MKALLLALALSCALAPAAGAATASRGDGPSVVVEIPGVGKVVGKESTTTRFSVPILKFLGIPFVAKPERFKPPTSFAHWSGERDVRSPAPGCPDLTGSLGDFLPLDAFFPGATAFAAAAKRAARAGRETAPDDDNEDCLTLDIYTHDLNPEKPLPVFFYIHGGAFVMGSSQMANGDFLLEHGDMVLVSVQYRLGPLGFLQSREADAPGNAALHDLHWALRWVREYIHLFGGDPNHIVAGGVSAGAALSGLLTVSPVTRDWLVGTALFSGGALVPWTVDADPWRSTRGVGVFAGCLRADTLAECLRSRSPSALNLAWGIWTVYETYFMNHGMGGVIPSLDPTSSFSLLPRAPMEELMDESFQGKPLLVGVTKHEGTFLMTQMDLMYIKARGLTEDQYTLDKNLGDVMLEFSDVEESLFTLGDAVKRLYFAEDVIGNYTAMFSGLVDFTGSGFFKGPAQRTAQLNAQRGGDSYLFSFEYAAENSVPSSLMGGDADTVHHGSDQYFLFDASSDFTERDYEIVNIYCDLVASFVTNLKPEVKGVNWRPHTIFDDYYLAVRLPPQELERFSNVFYIMEQERQENEWNQNSSEETDTQPTPTAEPSSTYPNTQTTNEPGSGETPTTPPTTPSTPKETDPQPTDPTSTNPSTPTTNEAGSGETTPEETDTEPSPTEEATSTNPSTQSTTEAGSTISVSLPLLISLVSLLLASC